VPLLFELDALRLTQAPCAKISVVFGEKWRTHRRSTDYRGERYGFGETRVATLALLTFTALSGWRSSGVVIAKFSAHSVILRSSPTVFADHSDIWVHVDPHLIWQATKSYVERGNAFALIPGHRVLADCPPAELPTMTRWEGTRLLAVSRATVRERSATGGSLLSCRQLGRLDRSSSISWPWNRAFAPALHSQGAEKPATAVRLRAGLRTTG
jgi:hypothetical protein